MEKVIVNVAKTPEGYCASIDILPGWVLGANGSFDEFRRELLESLNVFVEWAKEDNEEYPSVFDGDYDFEYKMNVESLLYCYNGIINRSAISRLTGINQKQLGRYANGRSRPRQEQKTKIVKALRQLGNELIAVSV